MPTSSVTDVDPESADFRRTFDDVFELEKTGWRYRDFAFDSPRDRMQIWTS